jgi:hypothetical protein
MEDQTDAISQAMATQNHIITGYILIGIITALSVAFFAVCGGVYLLRKSAQNQQQQVDSQVRALFARHRDESSQKDAASRQQDRQQQPHEAKAAKTSSDQANKKC